MVVAEVASGPVYVSYSQEDKAFVERLVRGLAGFGLDVTVDPDIAPGSSYTDGGNELVDAAGAVIVVWSEHSTSSTYVVREATVARATGRCVPITIGGPHAVPEAFRSVETLDLTGWDGEATDKRLEQLAREVSAIVNQAAETPEPTPAAATSAKARREPRLQLRPGATELYRLADAICQARGAKSATGVDLLLACLDRPRGTVLDAKELAQGATAAVVRAVPDPAPEHINAALEAADVDVTQISPSPNARVDGPRLAQVTAAAQALARQVAAKQVWSHHVVAVALSGDPLPAQVLSALGVTAGTLRAALRQGIAERWPGEAGAVWDTLLGEVPAAASSSAYDGLVFLVDDLESQAVSGLAVLVNERVALTVSQIVADLPFVLLNSPNGTHSVTASVEQGEEDERITALEAVDPFEAPTPGFEIDVGEVAADTVVEVLYVADGGAVDSLPGVVVSATATALHVRLSDPGSADRVLPGAPVLASGRLVGLTEAVSADRLQVVAGTAMANALERYGHGATSPTQPDQLDQPDQPDAETDAQPGGRSTVGNLEGAGNDRVGDVDQLGFDNYVQAFAELIMSSHSKPPLTIGVFGSWGTGKSFLLEHIEKEVERRTEARKNAKPPVTPLVHVVKFNAWEYSASAVVWPGLVRKIVATLDVEAPMTRSQRYWSRLQWNFSRTLRKYAPQIAAAAIVLVVGFAWAIKDKNSLAVAVGALVGTLGIAGLAKAANNPMANWVTTLFADSDYGERIGLMEDIRHDLEMLEKRLYVDGSEETEPIGRILVLIDDLDRCEPEKAVEVLQAVNLLLNFSSFIVILGIDARIVTAAVQKHYEGLLGETGASGYEYLDKIVQIPFRIPVPSPEEVETFLRLQLNVVPDATTTTTPARTPKPEPAEAETEAASETPPPTGVPAAPAYDENVPTADVPDDATVIPPAPPATVPPRQISPEAVAFTGSELEAFEKLSPYLRPNPRHLKRLINVYRLVRALALSRGDEELLANPAALLRWLVMWSQWPATSQTMLSTFDRLLAEDDLPSDDHEPDSLVELLRRASGSVNEEIRDKLDDDPRQLKALLALEGCRLSWEDIKRVRRYTVNFNPAIEEYFKVLERRREDEEAPAVVPG